MDSFLVSSFPPASTAVFSLAVHWFFLVLRAFSSSKLASSQRIRPRERRTRSSQRGGRCLHHGASLSSAADARASIVTVVLRLVSLTTRAVQICATQGCVRSMPRGNASCNVQNTLGVCHRKLCCCLLFLRSVASSWAGGVGVQQGNEAASVATGAIRARRYVVAIALCQGRVLSSYFAK